MKISAEIKQMTLIGLLSAITFLITFYFPIPLAFGYFNFSDAVIIFASVFIHPYAGVTVGMIGAGLADLVSGYSAFIPFTVIAKGVEALLAGYLYRAFKGNLKFIALYIGGLSMAMMYIPAYMLIEENVWAFVKTTPFDIAQGIIGASLAWILIVSSKKVKLMNPDV